MGSPESTVYRHLDHVVLLVGTEGDLARRCKMHFERIQIRVVRVLDAPEACDRLAEVMPQLVVVLDALDDDDRAELTDRTTAVGALLFHLDPDVDDVTLDTLLDRAAAAAVDRAATRDA